MRLGPESCHLRLAGRKIGWKVRKKRSSKSWSKKEENHFYWKSRCGNFTCKKIKKRALPGGGGRGLLQNGRLQPGEWKSTSFTELKKKGPAERKQLCFAGVDLS